MIWFTGKNFLPEAVSVACQYQSALPILANSPKIQADCFIYRYNNRTYDLVYWKKFSA